MSSSPCGRGTRSPRRSATIRIGLADCHQVDGKVLSTPIHQTRTPCVDRRLHTLVFVPVVTVGVVLVRVRYRLMGVSVLVSCPGIH